MKFDNTPESILLIVDTDPADVWVATRLLDAFFDRVIAVVGRAGAEEWLAKIPVTHVICGYQLDGQDVGTALIEEWRSRYPDIQRTVLLTALLPDDVGLNDDAVDGVVLRPFTIDRLRAAVKGDFVEGLNGRLGDSIPPAGFEEDVVLWER